MPEIFLLFRLLSISFFLFISLLIPAWSETSKPHSIIVDGSIGSSQMKVIEGPDYHIPAELGKAIGDNLFHSFQTFNVHHQERAIFYAPDTISAIISRVTGSESSWIDGGIVSMAPNADMYLINPNGVIFGPNVWLDVKRSFHVSTCDYIGFSDQTQFHVTDPHPLLFSTAPSSFGFIDNDCAPIHIYGKGPIVPSPESESRPPLYVPEGNTLSLIAGNMIFEKGTMDTVKNFPVGTLVSEKGRINIASVASAGEVIFLEHGLDISSFDRLGNVDIHEQSAISSGSGQIYVRANELTIDQSYINAGQYTKDGTTPDSFAGGTIDIQVNKFSLLNGSGLFIETFGMDTSGDITIIAEDVIIDGMDQQETPSTISTSSFFLDTMEMEQEKNTEMSDQICSIAPVCSLSEYDQRIYGNAGNIYIDATNIYISNGGTIEANAFSLGNGGNIVLKATQTIDISSIPNTFEICGIMAVSKSDQENTGNAGNISIQSKFLTIHNGEKIINSTGGTGNGGWIDIQVDETLSINGSGQWIEDNQNPTFPFISGIFSTTVASDEKAGNAGNISISGKTFRMNHYATVNASSESKGHAGKIVLDFTKLDMSDHAGIFSQSMSDGDSGLIFIKGEQFVSLKNYSGVSVQSMEKGKPGGVAIDTSQLIMEDHSIITSASLSSDNETNGGGVIIGRQIQLNESDFKILQSCENLIIKNQSKITTESHGKGEAGLLFINSQNIQMDDHAQISSSSLLDGNSGESGQIILNSETLFLNNASSITTENAGEGDAGLINIETHQLNLDQHSGIYSVNTHGNKGGRSGLIMICKKIESILPNDQSVVHPCETISIKNHSGITTSSLSESGAGGIVVRTKTLNMSTFGYISAENKFPGLSETIGLVSIRADTIHLASHSKISTLSEGDGDAGGISLEAGMISLIDDAFISSAGIKADKEGAGGHIMIARKISNIDNVLFGFIEIEDEASLKDIFNFLEPADTVFLGNGAYISTATSGSGNAGGMRIDAKNIVLSNNGWISSESTALSNGGTAGFIQIEKIVQLTLSQNSSISTQAVNTSMADIISPEILDIDRLNGMISIAGASDIHLSDSAITSSVLGGLGNGGNISIASHIMTMNRSQIIANAYDGNGGNIHMVSDFMIQSSDSIISASSERGIDGEIVIDASISIPDKALIKLADNFLDVSKWVQTPCNDRKEKNVSRLIIRGRDAQPTPFDDWLAH
ncbi:MAG: filamentous hemagglutinin N-terminal domain-containing protein [Candidatus Magnetomorum sp.]|nr:filamentous hemagglutinin N-terminal domain-containing protein [Candidatus Magnetomorum sp.]